MKNDDSGNFTGQDLATERQNVKPLFLLFGDAFFNPDADPMFDLDGNGRVNFEDFLIFSDAFQEEGRAKLFAMAEQLLGLPSATSLKQNYPNPFNAETTIRYTVARSGSALIDVYDLNGQLVSTLVDRHPSPGHYVVRWDGRNKVGASVSSGVYLVRLQVGRYVENKKITLMK